MSSDGGNLDMFLRELGDCIFRYFSCDLLLKFHLSFASVEFRTRRVTTPSKYMKYSNRNQTTRNNSEVTLDLVFKGSELVSISWLHISVSEESGRWISEQSFELSEVLLVGLVRTSPQFSVDRLSRAADLSEQSFGVSEVLLVGLVRTLSRAAVILNSAELEIHFTKCSLYMKLELRFRGWAPLR
jgi:hypothetical protein